MNNIAVMPHDDPERLRIFAREYVKTGSATTAVQRAGVQNSMFRMAVWAERLLSRADVQAYIAEAEEAGDGRRSKDYTRESIADDLQEVFERAMNTDELTPAVSAKKAQAEVLGLLEKNVNVTFTAKVTEMPMEALELELKRLMDDGVVTLTAGEDGVFRAEGEDSE